MHESVPSAELKAGEIISDRYRVIEAIGEGGMGTVYRVEHTLMDKQLAMKLLRPELSNNPEVIERFMREAKSAARLDDQHIVRVTDFGKTDEGALFLVMELLEGPSLTERMKEGALPVEEAIDVADQILSALEHAHENDIVHRDLKPDNMKLVERGSQVLVKILDFGLAKITTQEGAPLTQAGMVFGTPRYMSPEQAAGELVDHRADLYTVGVLLYEMVAGKPPFAGNSAVDILRAHLTEEPAAFELAIDADQGQLLWGVLEMALAKHPGERFPDATAFRQALAVCQPRDGSTRSSGRASESSTAPPPVVGPTPPPRSISLRAQEAGGDLVKRPPLLRLLLAGASIVLVIGALVFGNLFSIEGEIEQAKAALRAEDHETAARILEELKEQQGKDARVLLLEGHLAIARGQLKEAVERYDAALTADPSVVNDPMFVAQVHQLVATSRKRGIEVVKLVAGKGDHSAVPLLADLFVKGPNPKFRSYAYAGLSRLDALNEVDDPLSVLLTDLVRVKERSCETRKWYVTRIAAYDDERVLAALKKERGRKGRADRFGDINACMKKELDRYVAKRAR